MVRHKTLVVLGAGASKEVNFPTGNELKSHISRLLDIRFKNGLRQASGDYEILRALRNWAKQHTDDKDVNNLLHACWRIRDAMPQALSIDNFIDAHGGDEKIEICGKLAIVRAILAAENASPLYIDEHTGHKAINFSSVEACWLNRFVQLLTENCRINQLAERLSSITFVIFNYDRCFEHFLFHSLQNFYGISAEAASEFISGMEIYHPYGKVGNLPWQSRNNAVGFGAETDFNGLLAISDQIRTFSEGTDPDSSEIESIHAGMAKSTILVFLGFAFHTLNLQLLTAERSDFEKKHSFATAFGISNHDCQIIKQEIEQLCHGAIGENFVRNDLKCLSLFDEYWRSLALS